MKNKRRFFIILTILIGGFLLFHTLENFQVNVKDYSCSCEKNQEEVPDMNDNPIIPNPYDPNQGYDPPETNKKCIERGTEECTGECDLCMCEDRDLEGEKICYGKCFRKNKQFGCKGQFYVDNGKKYPCFSTFEECQSHINS